MAHPIRPNDPPTVAKKTQKWWRTRDFMPNVHRKVFFIAMLAPWCAAWAASPAAHVLVASSQPLSPHERHLEGVFEGLTRLDARGEVRPALAVRWHADREFRRWTFFLRTGARDHGGSRVSAQEVEACLRVSAQSLPMASIAAPSTHEVRIELHRPVRDLPKQLVAFRYFRARGQTPCTGPTGSGPLPAGTGPLRVVGHDTVGFAVDLERSDRTSPLIRLRLFKDESTAIRLVHTRAVDVVFNAFSTQKEEFIQRRLHWDTRTRPGAVATLLLLNGRSPTLQKQADRADLAHSIPWSTWIHLRGLGHWRPFDRFLSDAFNPRGPTRPLDLRGLVTPTGIGLENALSLKHFLRKWQVQLRLRVLDRAAYGRALRAGEFDWAFQRVMDGDLDAAARDYLHSSGSKNFTGLRSDEVDSALELGQYEKAWKIAEKEAHVFRLYRWDNTLHVRPDFLSDKGRSLDALAGAISPRGEMRDLLLTLMTTLEKSP